MKKKKADNTPFNILPHSEAPLFTSYKQGQTLIKQLINEVSGHMTTSEEVRQYLRQCGLVNLWFFLKFILGFNGPYNDINDEIHREMANWRQSESCMKPGARAAGFVPRAWFKSTIFSHGADTWETVRNPDIMIRLESGIIDKAKTFLGTIKNSYETNEFMHWLYPETKLPSGYKASGNWSSDEIIVPGRRRHHTDPTIKAGSMGGAAEGGHVNLYNSDDPVGLDDLDSMRNSSVDMIRKKNRFVTNKTSLLIRPKKDRVILVGTRYAIDDIYDIAINDAYEFKGYKIPEFETKPNGEWSIYNRLAEEDGVFVNPDVTDRDILEKAMAEDMWYAMTQLFNYPQKTGLAELNEMKAKFASIRFDGTLNDYVIRYEGDLNYEEEAVEVKLGECDVVMSVDPAGTDVGISAKTSRTSIGIWARDAQDRTTRIWQKVGYLSTKDMFESIFEGNRKFAGYVRATYVESNAMQRIILPLLRDAEYEKKQWINPQPLPAKGDKKARIRNVVGYQLSRGLLYLVREYSMEFLEEQAVFPMNEFKMDVLDESEKGLTATRTPMNTEELLKEELKEAEMELALIDNPFGY